MTQEYETVNTIFKETLSFQDQLVLFEGLKKTIDFLCLEKELTVVFLFDKFETYIPSVTAEFFTYLRTLRNRAKYRFATVFSLQKPLEEVMEPETIADFYEFITGHHVFLSLLDKPGVDFRIAYLEKSLGKTLSPTVKDTLIQITCVS